MPYSQNLRQLTGRVIKSRPGADLLLVRDWINERLRAVIDRRPTWSGLLKNVVVGIPNAYTAGTVSVTAGSTTVTGSLTNWPTTDVVNTTIVEEVSAPGAVWVTPASMSGITRDTILYVDANGPNPEVLPVLDQVGTRILLRFSYPHNAGFSAWCSSLSGLQLQVSGYTTPVFTVLAVSSPTSLVLDQPWGGASLTGSGYQIVKMYVTLDPYFKDVLVGVDPFQGIQLRLHVSQAEINAYDPNRTATNSPQALIDRGPNLCGNFQHEIWPVQTTAYQLNFLIRVGCPDLRTMDDYPPPFINPNVLVYGALADAFRTPCPRPPNYEDPYFNLQAAASYEQMFERAIAENINADESLYQKAFQWAYVQTFGAPSMGANFLVSHDMDAIEGNY